MVTKAIEGAQKRVEGNNFSTRKHLLEYDDVMNKQRENVYSLRRELLEGQIKISDEEVVDSRGYVMTLGEELVDEVVETHAGKDVDEPDTGAVATAASDLFGIEPEALEQLNLDQTPSSEIAGKVFELAKARYDEKDRAVGIDPDHAPDRRDIMLQIVDVQWKDHLYSLDHLKEALACAAAASEIRSSNTRRKFALFRP
jgi:preprotein translocase subunit SecA